MRIHAKAVAATAAIGGLLLAALRAGPAHAADEAQRLNTRALAATCRIDPMPEGLPPAPACLVGYLGYETIGLVETLPRAADSPLDSAAEPPAAVRTGSGSGGTDATSSTRNASDVRQPDVGGHANSRGDSSPLRRTDASSGT